MEQSTSKSGRNRGPKIKARRYIYSGFTLIQLLLITAVCVLEKLTETRALVMRHVYTKRLHYLPFIEGNSAQIGLGILVLFSLYLVGKYKNKALGIALVTLAIVGTLLFEFTKAWMTYPYILAVLLACWLIEFIKLKVIRRGYSDFL